MSGSFEQGSTIGGYRVLSRLGAGGMGEVYLAEDGRLRRKLAVKVLPPATAEDQARRARFLLEARNVSALKHPNIVTIYEMGVDQGRDFIAMEWVDGESLRSLITRGRLPVRKALEIGEQIASALAAGHDAGIIHRDIKPENVMIAADGTVKVLDYGLAKAMAEPDGAPPSESSTAMPLAVTRPGSVVGTVAYMSPEQAQGLALDHRTDIFSLGVVLYEMITGQRPFTGSSLVDQLHAIVHAEPLSVVDLRPDVPSDVIELLERSLAKSPRDRHQHAADLRHDLGRLKGPSRSGQFVRLKPSARNRVLSIGGALLMVLAVAGAGYWIGARRAEKRVQSSSSSVFIYPLTSDPGYEGEPTFSPDGRTIAYVSDRSGNLEIYLRLVDGVTDVNLTNDPGDDLQPAYSPDGREIAFVSSREGASNVSYKNPGSQPLGGDIWVMSALGGALRRVARAGNFPSWAPDGARIVYTAGPWRGQKIYTVPATGGTPAALSVAFEEPPLFLLHPSYSRDARWIVFAAANNVIYVVPSGGGHAVRIASGRHPAWNADSTEILFSTTERGRNETLWSVPFSIEKGAVAGSEHPITVGRGRDVQASASRDGRFIAYSSQDVTFNIEKWPFDVEKGRITGPVRAVTAGREFAPFFAASADGMSVVYESTRGSDTQIWRVDEGKLPVRLTSDPKNDSRQPDWAPDGSRIAFHRRAPGPARNAQLCVMSADGTNPVVVLGPGSPTSPGCTFGPSFLSWTPDSRSIAYYSVEGSLCLVDVESRKTRRFRGDSDSGRLRAGQAFSADGEWLICLVTGVGDKTDIDAAPVAGGPNVTVVATPLDDFHPQVASSDRWLYFSVDHKNLHRVPGPAQGWKKVAPEKVTNFPESNLYLDDPEITRDGKWLIVSRQSIASDIWIIDNRP